MLFRNNSALLYSLRGTKYVVCPLVYGKTIKIIEKIEPNAKISVDGAALPFPTNLSDEPLRAYLSDYGSVGLVQGIEHTYDHFCHLVRSGKIGSDAFA